ncbi:hypothetical protein Taro_006926 [Colocasia esculenta]|uniref:Uncharacterized protein n=1 Tax=Colocasia esculenta TaxID=4460 RepID=A0A843TWQ4_COLES|nr:hypothetical protein [Colocasia esculenta]
MELGERRRWPFRREGPNGSALLLEVGTLDSSHLSMLPPPLRMWFLRGLGLWGRENHAHVSEDSIERRFVVNPCFVGFDGGLSITIVSRQLWASRHGRDGPMRRDYSRDR